MTQSYNCRHKNMFSFGDHTVIIINDKDVILTMQPCLAVNYEIGKYHGYIVVWLLLRYLLYVIFQ